MKKPVMNNYGQAPILLISVWDFRLQKPFLNQKHTTKKELKHAQSCRKVQD